MKMIIRNCPAFDSKYNECHSKIEPHKLYCMDCTDCVMKQIVELCKRTCRMRCTNDCSGTKKHCGYGQILQLLDIQEVE